MRPARTPTRRIRESSTSMRTEQFEAVVIGGGQAGLAAGHYLAARDVDYVVLSDEARIGDNWRRRWDSLRLFTPAAYSGLPGMPFPAPPHHLPDKDEVADYLERYAERFEIPVRLGSRVASVERVDGRFVVDVDGGATTIETPNVVVATGPFSAPRIPAVARAISPHIVQLHSSEYRNPWAVAAGPVLVVGAGNSGAQIALELARFRRVWLAGPDTGHLPRRVLGRDLFDWIWPIMDRVQLDSTIGRRIAARMAMGGDALIGIPEAQLRSAGVRRVGRVHSERGGLPLCGDEVIDPGVIVWCTGFAPEHGWLPAPAFDADGRPRHRRGESVDAEGLFFVGLRGQRRVASSLLGGVGADAAYVADRVARRCAAAMAMAEVEG